MISFYNGANIAFKVLYPIEVSIEVNSTPIFALPAELKGIGAVMKLDN